MFDKLYLKIIDDTENTNMQIDLLLNLIESIFIQVLKETDPIETPSFYGQEPKELYPLRSKLIKTKKTLTKAILILDQLLSNPFFETIFDKSNSSQNLNIIPNTLLTASDQCTEIQKLLCVPLSFGDLSKFPNLSGLAEKLQTALSTYSFCASTLSDEYKSASLYLKSMYEKYNTEKESVLSFMENTEKSGCTYKNPWLFRTIIQALCFRLPIGANLMNTTTSSNPKENITNKNDMSVPSDTSSNEYIRCKVCNNLISFDSNFCPYCG